MKLATVKIHLPSNPAHSITINAKDFDPAIHTLFADKAPDPSTVTHAQEQLQQTEEQAPAPPSVGRESREAELNSLYYGPDGTAANWAPIKAIAAEHGIVKPEGGWEDAIALILEAEYANA